MALGANALTSVAYLAAELGLTVDATVTARLEVLIDRASDAIERYCNRVFIHNAAVVEKVVGYGGMRLVVSRTPLLSIASITYDGATIESTNYEIHEAESGEIRFLQSLMWTTVRLPIAGRDPYPGEERKLYQATYAGGYTTRATTATPTLPTDVEEACIIAAVYRYRRTGRDPSVQSERLMSYSVTYANDEETLATGLPPEARGLLSHWRRAAFV